MALFGTGAARVALSDLAALETQEAAQRAAEAATGKAADLVFVGASTSAEIDAAAQQEATAVATADLVRGSVASVAVTRTSSPTELVRVQVTLVTSYGGLVGPLRLTASGTAAVPRTGP
ncbi:MAG TPA: hypothetical protein VGA38_03285 [Candidatus Limnocylindria bacterium]